jgi:hypothetical protein
MSDTILLAYRGGIAEDGELHFYEFGRAEYAFARFLATVEHFRRTGRVAERINRSTYVDMRVRAPRRGSFLTEIVIPLGVSTAANVFSLPLSALLSQVLHLLTPRSAEREDDVVELARIRLAESQERTAQSGEETARLRVLQQIIETQAATARQSLELLQWGLESGNVAIARAGLTPQNLTDLEADFSAELGRQRELEPYAEQLAEINPTDMSRLTSRVRPMVQEVALPLRRSASSFTLSDPANDNVLAFFDSQRAQALSERESLEEPIRLTCKIKAYDREIGVGKLRSTN